LIDTEIEIRSGRGDTFAEAAERQRLRRERLFAIADELGLALAAMGTHPWANYLDQHIIDTEHYRRLEKDLRWVAQRNNTWSLHVHVGIRGPDRAVAVSDRMRELLPPLLALSANSPFLDHRDTGLHSVRTEIFTRVFPRCGVHEPFGNWETYSDFVRLLKETGSIVEATQLWWSVRPHHSFGTVEVRICDAQTRGDESLNLAALIAACVAQSAIELDEGRGAEPLRQREIEENLWRAIRYGMDGEMIDFRKRRLMPTQAVVEELVRWTEPARSALGLEVDLPEQNGAQRAYARFAEGAPIEEIYRRSVEETRRTYAPEGAVSGR
jgi:carboxylate-amine ligase